MPTWGRGFSLSVSICQVSIGVLSSASAIPKGLAD